MHRLKVWAATCLLLVLVRRGATRPLINDFASVPISPSIVEDTDDAEIDKFSFSIKIRISADIRVSHDKEPPEDKWQSSGEVDRGDHQHHLRNDTFQVPETALSPEQPNLIAPADIELKNRHDSDAQKVSYNPDDVTVSEEPEVTTPAPASHEKELSGDNFSLASPHVTSTTLPVLGGDAEVTSPQDGVQAQETKEDSNVTPAETDESSDDDSDSTSEVTKEKLPTALQNLPRDIPNDRTISEILAENMVQDKQYDEMRIEELIDELMAHTMGFGEVYSSNTD